MEKTIITFVRHAENISSKSSQKWHPGPNLTKAGRWQAEKIGRYLKFFEFDKIFSSDMSRAMQTANIITKYLKDPYRTSISFHRKFSEHDEILYESRKRTSKFKTEMAKAKRSVAFFNKILKSYPGKNILIVVHGNVIRACFGTSLGFTILKTPKLHLLHGSISSAVFEGNKLTDIYYLNSVGHYTSMKFVDKFSTVRFSSKP